MESHLFTHQEPPLAGTIQSSTSAWKERYFISYPFCGVKWFEAKPNVNDKHITMNQSDPTNTKSGWVMGGSLRALSVFPVDTVIRLKVNRLNQEGAYTSSSSFARKNVINLYCFILHLRTDAFGDIAINLAAETKTMRDEWLEEFNRNIYMQQYLYACTQVDAAPTRSACFSTREETGNLAIENLRSL